MALLGSLSQGFTQGCNQGIGLGSISSQGLTREESTSKLRYVVVGRIWFLVCFWTRGPWLLAIHCLEASIRSLPPKAAHNMSAIASSEWTVRMNDRSHSLFLKELYWVIIICPFKVFSLVIFIVTHLYKQCYHLIKKYFHGLKKSHPKHSQLIFGKGAKIKQWGKEGLFSE